ncbi:MAG: glycine cleavage system aminomethyltransferase GcvT [Anaerolineaceae bacterium]|nr:glycine cleavage system aminomethyltransferase GcvT [Anaerolineaceae bacterium]
MKDFLFEGSLEQLDPAIQQLNDLETERQYRRLILIPSESSAPLAVREALSSIFQNIYAEGYPDEDTRWMDEEELLDYPMRLANYRRYSDPRYYKGVEYADVLEALARRRCAEAFASNGVSADELYINVQALSGAAANNAAYHAMIEPGDTVLGMDLLHGGHLSHGSPVNRSGKLYNIIHYTIDPTTEKIDYDAIQALALEHKPKVIIAGYSSYPWIPDFKRYREIADSVGAKVLADVSHIAGLIAAGVVESPVGYADIITFTTHKTLCGPRGAIIISQDGMLSKKIDRAVFPGEQGGPHVQVFAAYALTFKLAQTEKFKALQTQIIKNCSVLTDQLSARGFKIPFGGTNSHLGNIDCKSIVGPDGATLSGDMAARILDIAGIVTNRNTIPGDRSAFRASGVRYGTPWMTQRGLDENDMLEVANIIADVLQATTPYKQPARKGSVLRAKVDFKVLEEAKIRVRKLAEKGNTDIKPQKVGYPHFYYLDDKPAIKDGYTAYELHGKGIYQFVNAVFASDVEALTIGASQQTTMQTPMGIVEGVLKYKAAGCFVLSTPADKAVLAATWLRALSDGFVKFDDDLLRKLPGPISVIEKPELVISEAAASASAEKPYSINQQKLSLPAKSSFAWQEDENPPLQRTALYETHKAMGAKVIPFAGWEMPVWYTSVTEEHLATRQAAGLFDASHMGCYQVEGSQASAFLDSVVGNDISQLAVGESAYTHLLDPQANVLDDLIIYRRSSDNYLVVVNAGNDDKDWSWLNGVMQGNILIDEKAPYAKAFGRGVTLRNLRDPKEGADMRVDIPLQGPKSRDILLALGCDEITRKRIMKLGRTQLCEGVVGGIDLIISRTGYTGERMAFELFVHPQKSVELWNKLIEAGTPMGLKPCGLGARDSLRTEAGLPLYGHEMAGELGLGVAEAGFAYYVKTYKPWFVGREAYLARESQRSGIVARFRFDSKGVRMAHLGDPVLNTKGQVIGKVTSCAVDSEGYLTGQAFVEMKYAEENTAILIYQSASDKTGKSPASLKVGDKQLIPTPATIVSRFPKS